MWISSLWHFGAKPDKKVLENLGLDLNEWGYIKVNENMETSLENVFASGDLIRRKIDCCLGCKVWKKRSREDI
ncbi:MAG: NAD(P)/FAD-dependent oxidoreductase [Clostridia bacterium]|nr:NAD(P)/FAD-dependent oxidoreductase [Clostridia bacterium]